MINEFVPNTIEDVHIEDESEPPKTGPGGLIKAIDLASRK
jgi:hypothetical protein